MNGIPLNLIEEAKGKLDDSKVNMDKLLHELNREKSYLEQLNKAHIEAQELAEAARLDYIQKKERFEERMRAQQDVIEKNNLYLNSGKKISNLLTVTKPNRARRTSIIRCWKM